MNEEKIYRENENVNVNDDKPPVSNVVNLSLQQSEPSKVEKIGMILEEQMQEKTVPNIIADSFFKSEEDKKKFNDLSFFRIGNNFRTYWPHDTASQEFKIPALYLNEW